MPKQPYHPESSWQQADEAVPRIDLSHSVALVAQRTLLYAGFRGSNFVHRNDRSTLGLT